MKAATKRKLVDIKAPVFEVLSSKAKGKNVSLKRYIEELLEEDARQKGFTKVQGVTDERILRLIGSAKPAGGNNADIQDERLQYILSK